MGIRSGSSCVSVRLSVAFAFSLLVAAPLAAQHVRVTSGPAPVTQWRMAGETIATLPTGTMLEVIDREGNWFWVMLPPDRYGTNRVGWINGSMLDAAAGAIEPNSSLSVPTAPNASDGAAYSITGAPAGGWNPHWQLQAVGGLTFGNASSQLFGGAAGLAWSRNVLIAVEVGRIADITSAATRDEVTAIASSTQQMLSVVTGRRFDVVGEASMPAVYGMAGLQYTAPRASRARPFVSGHTGFASVNPTLRLLVNGDDRTSSFLPPGTLAASRTRLLFGGGTGLTIRMTKALSVDVGYRYSRILVDEGINLNRVYAALGFGF